METATLCEFLPMDVGVARSCEASSWRPSIELVPQSFQREKSQQQSWSTLLHFACEGFQFTHGGRCGRQQATACSHSRSLSKYIKLCINIVLRYSRNIYKKYHYKAVVKLRRQTWQASDSQRYSKRQCRQCIQFRQCRLQSQELRKTCIISCENWSAAKQSHLLGSHFAFHYPVLTFSWFLSQSNTSWIVLEWSWKVFWNPNIPSGGDVIFWRALQGAWLGIHPMATWKRP